MLTYSIGEISEAVHRANNTASMLQLITNPAVLRVLPMRIFLFLIGLSERAAGRYTYFGH